MYYNLLINLFIIGFLLFLGGQIVKNNPIDGDISLRSKMYVGLAAGITGTILMIYSIPLENNMIIDLRHLAIIIAAIYCGTVAIIICAIECSVIGLFNISRLKKHIIYG